MGVFAKINEDNIVEQVISIPDEFDESGESFISDTLQLAGTWKHSNTGSVVTSGCPAFIGAEYLPDVGKFIPPKPSEYPSFIFDTDNWKWVAPVVAPSDSDWLVGFTEPPVPFDIETADDGTPTFINFPVIEADKNVYVWDEQNINWIKTTHFEPKEVPLSNIDEMKSKQRELAPASFIENEEGFLVPPTPYPTDGKFYMWDEPTISWVETEEPLPPHLIAE